MVNRFAAGAAVPALTLSPPPENATASEEPALSDIQPAPEARFSIVEDSTRRSKLDWKMVFPFVVLALIALIGIYMVSLFVGEERWQAETDWRIRMGIVADSRAADVNHWFDQQFAELYGIAQNQ